MLGLEIATNHLCVAPDHRQDVVEVVSHPRREAPDGLQVLLSLPSSLQTLLRGEVQDNRMFWNRRAAPRPRGRGPVPALPDSSRKGGRTRGY